MNRIQERNPLTLSERFIQVEGQDTPIKVIIDLTPALTHAEETKLKRKNAAKRRHAKARNERMRSMEDQLAQQAKLIAQLSKAAQK
jgi:hypothetical protein